MKITYSWLQELTNTTLSVEEVQDRLTMLGLEVEAVYSTVPEVEGVVIGEVLEVQPIENSAHLKSCKVNIGHEQVQVVCGAPNVAAGQKVPLAMPGALLPNGMKISRRKIRGVLSHGMICSEAELHLSDDAEGIMVLDDQAPVGEPFKAYLGKQDYVFELGITPNRPDCLGAIGIAREICVSEGRPFESPLKTVSLPLAGNETVSVDILASDACPRYTARLIRHVKIGPSPRWLVDRLRAVGLRSINNVVDVTNYVMMETGQPLHAFDYDLLKGGRIVVRTAKDGEKFVTLDGKEHTLKEGNLLICDAERAVALAGIMGGENSEVSDNTRHILLESAYFAPFSIRKTTRQLGISTDSSRRFERGVDPNGADLASNRATQLILEVAGGELASDLVDAYPGTIVPVEIEFRPQRSKKVLGLEIPENDMQRILTHLGCEVDASHSTWRIKAPTFRPDLEREIDLIEEVARIYGYNDIPNKTLDTIHLDMPSNCFDAFVDRVRHKAASLSLSEIVTLSMVSRKQAAGFVDSEDALLSLVNPLSEDMAVMRPTLFTSMLSSVVYNLNRKQIDLRFFEVGNVFRYDPDSKKVIERRAFSAVGTGRKFMPSWDVKAETINFFDMKGIVTEFLHQLHLHNVKFAVSQYKFFEYSADLLVDEQKIGYIGKFKKSILALYDIKRDVFGFELYLEDLYPLAQTALKFQPISAFPPVERDLALVVDKDRPAAELEAVIRETAGPLLRELTLFDLYSGPQIPEDKKSLAFSLVFQSDERTLTDEEINTILDDVLKAVNVKLGATLRQ
ncbi:MAG: phenylalanine--tRNA ligase subunit beta [candidate division KSB1 bacterium]|nr:phenylalanine--tRNA ligase subunit beta [candidate division KSB1 bacterium]